MTQQDFNALPLLLRYTQVVAVLDGLNKRALLESIADGSLRHWPPTPEPRHRRYYLKRDVARMAGLQMQGPELPRLTGWMRNGELLKALGLGRDLFLNLSRHGVVDCERQAGRGVKLKRLAGFFDGVGEPRSP